uniref:Uncharacterized protein n=1 Tax=Arundo donax TaxID=35708 RepID=A0A0A9C5N2_ARUDO
MRLSWESRRVFIVASCAMMRSSLAESVKVAGSVSEPDMLVDARDESDTNLLWRSQRGEHREE